MESRQEVYELVLVFEKDVLYWLGLARVGHKHLQYNVNVQEALSTIEASCDVAN